MKCSVVISAFNEENNIKDCLRSVIWADEIIFVDNKSSDETVKIAKKYTSNIFSRPNNPLMLNINKNYGFTKATGDWILSLDADERVSKELREEIQNILKLRPSTGSPVGFLIPRKNIIFGKWIKHGLWYPDHQLRLFKKGKGKFPQKHNHELVEIDGHPEKFTSHLIHYNYSSVNQYITKIMDYYADNEVDSFLTSGKTLHWYDAIRMPASDFLTNFFAREGYKDGLHGLVLAFLQAFYTFIVFAKVWEKQGFWEYESEDFVMETRREFEEKRREIAYWMNQVRMKNAPIITRYILMLKQKLFS